MAVKTASDEELVQFKQDIETLIKRFGSIEKIPTSFGISAHTLTHYYSDRKRLSSVVALRVRTFVLGLPNEKLSKEAEQILWNLLQIQFQLGVCVMEQVQMNTMEPVFDISLTSRYRSLIGEREDFKKKFIEAVNRRD